MAVVPARAKKIIQGGIVNRWTRTDGNHTETMASANNENASGSEVPLIAGRQVVTGRV